VLLMKGLTGMVMQAQTQTEKLDVLCSGNQAMTQPVYCVLSFFDDKMNKADTIELDNQETWLEEAISSVTKLLNTGLEHPFLSTCMEICHEFIESSFISLGSQTRSQELKFRLVLFVAQFGHSRHLGLHIVRRIMASFSDIAERLREASNYNYTDTSCLDKFHILMNLVLEMWPLYVASVIPCRSDNVKKKIGDRPSNKRKSQEDSRPEEMDFISRKKYPKKRSGGGGDGELRPLLSLAETRDLQTEVSHWRRILSRCTNRLSVMQPEFCGAIWKVDRFCQGLEHSLTFGSC